jgi:hypothetical protein
MANIKITIFWRAPKARGEVSTQAPSIWDVGSGGEDDE